MRILFASMPADGHFNPLTGIAAHLSARGHDVRWYAGPQYARKLDSLGMTSFPYQRATEITGGSINDLPERAGLRGPKLISFDLEKFFVANVDNHFRDIVDIRSQFPFDVFFCDGAMYVEKLVAELLGRTRVRSRAHHGDARRAEPATLLRSAPGPHHPGQDRARRREAHARQHHEGRRAHLQRHPREPRPRTHPARRVPVRADGQCAPGVPQRLPRGWSSPATAPRTTPSTSEPLVPARGALRPDTPLPPAVLDPDAKVVAVSQGTVDNTDPTKLIVPTLEALEDGPYVVVATTAGTQTAELRDRFGSAERRHRGLHRLRRAVPACGRLRHQWRLRQRARGDAPRCSGPRGRQDRREERHRRAGRLQPPRRRPPERASEAGQDPRAACVGCSVTRRTPPTSTRCGRSSPPTTPWVASRPRSTTSRSPRHAARCPRPRACRPRVQAQVCRRAVHAAVWDWVHRQ